MYLGSGFTTLGEEEKTIEYIKSRLDITNLILNIKPSAGYGNAWFGIYVNERLIRNVYLTEGVESAPIYVPDITQSSAVFVLHHGNNQTLNLADIVKLYFSVDRQTVSGEWSWDYDVIGVIDDGDDIEFLSNWSFDNLHWRQLNQISDTRGYISINVTIDGSDVTVIGSNSNGQLFTGTGADSSTITLTGTITGSVDVATAAVLSGARLNIRYPISMSIYRNQTSPPTTLIDTVYFAQQDSFKWSDPAILSAGNYYYAYKVTSDTNDVSALSTPELITISGIPDAPSGLAYASGNAAATTLNFTASETVGATYNLYVKQINDTYFDFETAAATAIAGSTSIVIPALTGYPGTVLAVLRAEFSGQEEKNNDILELEYDAAGAFVQARPNTPILGAVTINGLEISVAGTYNPANQAAAATKLQLFARDPDDSYDFGTPDNEQSLINNAATLTATLIKGWWYVTLKSANASVQSTDRSNETLVYVSADDASVSNVTFTAEV